MGRTRSAAKATPTRPEDAKLGLGPTFAYGLQHVLTMYGGIIAPPLVIGQAAGLSQLEIGVLIASALFIGGLATVLQTIGIPFFGSQLPLVQGVSFAGVATMLAILSGGGGLPAVFGAILASAVIGILIAPFFAMIVKFFPPVVTGVVITSIGLTLIPVAGTWAMGGAGAPDFGDPANLGLAGVALLIMVLLTKFGTPALARLAILVSLVLATVVAAFFGRVDFAGALEGPIFAVPMPFQFGLPTFEPAAIISMLIVVLVTFTETTADILAVGEVVGTKVDSKRIAAGLRADMLSSAVSPIFNSFTQSAFAQNVGLVAITKVKSRYVVAAGGVVLVLLGVLPAIYDAFPTWFQIIFHSGISSATIMAVLLNVLFNHVVRRSNSRGDRSTFVAAPTRLVPEEALTALEEGDYYVGGKLIDKDGAEVRIVPTGSIPAVDPERP